MQDYYNNYDHISFKKAWGINSSIARLLGECVAYINAIIESPIIPKYRTELLKVSLIKGAQASTAIEGNTLSVEHIIKLREGSESLPPSKVYLQKEVDNVIDAMNFIMKKLVDKNEIDIITPDLIAHFHKYLGRGIGEAFNATPGEYRSSNVIVSSYRPPSAGKVISLVENLCKWLKSEFGFPNNDDIGDAIIQAVVTHLYIAWIHPFSDGNGRTARLLEFYILMRIGVPNIASHVLSNHYNETRTMYYRQIEIATKNKDITGFLYYALEGYRDGLADVLGTVQQSQLHVFWRSFIFDTFNEFIKNSSGSLNTTMLRRRELILLWDFNEAIETTKVEKSNPDIHLLYLDFSNKTLHRDIEWLVGQGLLRKEEKGYVLNKEILRTHMARRVERW
jgi:Fic family protein